MDQTAPAASTTQANPVADTKTADKSAVSVRGMTSLVDALYAKGLVNDEVLKTIKFESITSNTSPEQLLLSKQIVGEEEIQKTRSEMFGIGYVELNSITIPPETLNKLPSDMARKNTAVIFEETNNRFKVAMYDPLDLQRVKFLESVLKKRVDAYYSTSTAINHIIDTKYGAQITQEVTEALEDVGVVELDNVMTAEDLSKQNLDNAPVSKIVSMILDYAVKHQASDIHIEPREGKVSVRYRVHGILGEKLVLPLTLAPSIVSRIKILSNMKIDEHRVPQDNRFQIRTGDKVVDIRVSIMPAIYGEKVVMRLLEKGGGALSLETTGLRGPGYKAYKEALGRTQGIILITGPTGSGKTQTLASSLSILNKQEVNIVTVEDPVEIRIDGINQVQVNPEVGLTFANALRSFLRQDPDIIMVGEIRDSETANLAVQAALVGRLVLATLHTNSAAGAIPRLLDMGVQPFLLSSTINVIVAQRLVRRLCDDCKAEYEASDEIVDMLHKSLDTLHGFDLMKKDTSEKIHFDSRTEKVKLYKAVGCPKCNDSGYRGRIGIFEVMEVTQKIGKMIMGQLSSGDLQTQALADGMITMVQDGYMKALEGMTTVEEVIRVQNV